MSTKKLEKRSNQKDEEYEQIKLYKKMKKHQNPIEFLDEEEVDDDLLSYCQKYLK